MATQDHAPGLYTEDEGTEGAASLSLRLCNLYVTVPRPHAHRRSVVTQGGASTPRPNQCVYVSKRAGAAPCPQAQQHNPATYTYTWTEGASTHNHQTPLGSTISASYNGMHCLNIYRISNIPRPSMIVRIMRRCVVCYTSRHERVQVNTNTPSNSLSSAVCMYVASAAICI